MKAAAIRATTITIVRKPSDELEPRQGEDEEAEVEVELRVLGAERHAGCATAGRSATGRPRREPASRPRTAGHDDVAIRRSGSIGSR